jgi:hypothetical protein
MCEIECPYFPRDLDNFGILLKGPSLKVFPRYAEEFHHCFIVSDFSDELPLFAEPLARKAIVHFYGGGALTGEEYRRFDIRNVQFSRTRKHSPKEHYKQLFIQKIRNRNFSIRCHPYPAELTPIWSFFGSEYVGKMPSTGLGALVYAVEVIKPRNLWVFGLDLYHNLSGDLSKNYLVPQTNIVDWKVTYEKSERLQLVPWAVDYLASQGEVNIRLASVNPAFQNLTNVQLID